MRPGREFARGQKFDEFTVEREDFEISYTALTRMFPNDQLLLSKRFQNIGNLFPESGISGSDISFFTSDTAGSENKSATREEERKSLNKRKRPLLRLSSDKGHCIT